MDLQDRQREMQEIREHLHRQYEADRQQEDDLAALRTENEELKLYVTALVRLLGRKGVMTEQEVQEMVQSVEGTG